jgi:predicted small lipoprotein YifL
MVKPAVAGEKQRASVHPALIAGAVVLALVAVTLVILFSLRACGKKPGPVSEPPRPLTPAERTEPQTLPPVPGSVPTESLPPTQSAIATPQPDSEAHAERIAFRLGTTIYVAAPDGSDPIPAARLGEGPYALSPDGRTLAVVSGGRLSLVDVASGGSVDAGEAWSSGALMGECPVWLPDSRSLMYVRRAPGDAEGHVVRRISSDGTGARSVTPGRSPSVSPDGRVIAVIGSDGSGPDSAVVVSRNGGSFKQVEIPGHVVTAVAAGNDRLFVGVLSPDGSCAIVSVRMDGSRLLSVAGAPVDLPRTVWGALRLSPDGSRLVACATGDDQISRTSIIPVGGGSAVLVDVRRDTYPKGWSRSGEYFNYIQGNAYQGEETALLRMKLDGTERRVLITGAQ